jgi:hypothetical protein
VTYEAGPPLEAKPEASHGAGHEARDVRFRPIVAAGLTGVVVVVLAFVVVRWLFAFYLARDARLGPPANPLAASYGRELPPEPRLQANPLLDIAQLRAAEDAILEGYGWVDRKQGVVRIPIERAIELTAERGLPARAATAREGGK